MADAPDNLLGAYLRDRREKLDPAALGLPATRRRTPGLRREEVAQRAHVSVAWYTWLEQGRGGAPSADVLDRLARALMLNEAEREHLFLIGLGHPPEVRYHAPAGVTPRLQHVLDSLDASPAIIRTATWDVAAWNDAAAATLTDYATLPPAARNILRLIFVDAGVRHAQSDWERVARFAVGGFRADVARSGATQTVQAFVDEMRATSAEFDAMWRDHDIRTHEEATKEIRHPRAGRIALEHSTFSVTGRPDLSLVIFTPATPADRARIRELVAARERARATQAPAA
ncbi:helix-turn-helix transcriptional regulator [Burkholderia cenocepacia]|uniref:Helix-turn-helix transcriptional regulator n=1 Tax=Burkholderia cenocepacia TaxID=95486 RepID=A0ABD4U886_9BURK|nr:helix-turn-helix transcriptional regulator [Burkholderia cenocepacia]MCW3694730.1 helix-turn-helix transcriptional regulator [Burkholderia cenocepacia]MCW3701890.1 helix-turn-helix transcriptional regulator [Burkholderia cenocepacia]MCW3710623.1 helix-turn-helix transcriptional regulator [Burkholderia cenocepacia]MCW3718580.1 helix-turn-helix transcriptional regulator [Burkholderia cenocepacia]MCW3725951.1 helix-turn-helix transcriptional regulator [Burkholderia cenocepacia]